MYNFVVDRKELEELSKKVYYLDKDQILNMTIVINNHEIKIGHTNIMELLKPYLRQIKLNKLL